MHHSKLLLILASFVLLGCVGMQENQSPATAGTASGQPSGAVQPAVQEPACPVPEEHCAYDNVSQLLTCGSGYQIGGYAVLNGSYYWVDACQAISVKPNHLITLFGPFESEEEYDEYIAEEANLISQYRNATGIVNETALYEDLKELQDSPFRGRRRSDYVNFLFTANGTYAINNETSVDSVAEKISRSMAGE